MDVWPWLIFGCSVVLALRSLAGLMTAERDRLLNEAAAQAAAEQAQQDEEQAAKKGKKGRGSGRKAA
jgi:hypothetical protein